MDRSAAVAVCLALAAVAVPPPAAAQAGVWVDGAAGPVDDGGRVLGNRLVAVAQTLENLGEAVADALFGVYGIDEALVYPNETSNVSGTDVNEQVNATYDDTRALLEERGAIAPGAEAVRAGSQAGAEAVEDQGQGARDPLASAPVWRVPPKSQARCPGPVVAMFEVGADLYYLCTAGGADSADDAGLWKETNGCAGLQVQHAAVAGCGLVPSDTRCRSNAGGCAAAAPAAAASAPGTEAPVLP